METGPEQGGAEGRSQAAARESKRAQFEQEPGVEKAAANNNSVKILALVALALAGLAVYFVAGRDRAETVAASGGGGMVKSQGAAGAGGEVSIPVSELGAKARFYEYKTASGKTVRFFAMKSSDGVYRAALDSCDVCFAAKKGYRQEGDDMVCNNCGNHFHSSQINEVGGGCNPVGLQRKVEGDRVVIDARSLEAGASYF
jgi:uncharacterized membrane protein